MNDDRLSQNTSSLRERLDRLEQQLAGSANQKQEALTIALQDLRITLEELEVAEEELAHQNQQLIESRAALEAERQRYVDLFEFAPDAYLVTDTRGKIQEANRAACNLLGVQAQFIAGKLLSNYIVERDLRAFRFELNRIAAAYEAREMELRLSPRNGRPFWATLRVVASHDSDGKISALRWLLRDITKQREAEEALRESEQRFRMMADTAPVLSWQAGKDKLCYYFNKPWLDFTGRTLEQEIGDGWQESVHPDDFRHCLDTYSAAFDARQGFSLEYRLRRYDGEYRWVFNTGVPVYSPDGGFKGYIGSCIDITDRKRAETALRESQRQLASIIGSTMDAIITVDADQRIVLFNAAAEKMFHCPADAAIGQSLDRFIPERFRALHREHVQRFGDTNITSRSMGSPGAISGMRADGEEFPIEASISQVEVDSKKLFTVIIRDISRLMEDEDRLREQAALLDQAPDAIMVRDLEDHIVFWSKGAEQIYGWTAEEAVGKHVRDLHYKDIDEDYYAAKQRVFETGYWSGEAWHVTKSGGRLVAENRWTLLSDQQGNPERILVINTDITEKKRLEEQFLRAQRMESVGMLASGIAHDLGNILSPVLMAVQLLRLNFDSPERESFLSIIERNGARGAGLLRQILGFARGVEGGAITLQCRHIIKEIETVIKETFPKSIAFEVRVPEDLWPVRGDATQLHQVLMNLCINARDAMPRGGKLVISAENLCLDEVYSNMQGNISPGRYILLKVADTGSGIAAEHLDRVFDPFFTTKEPGKGTGLGLASVVDIMKSHKGLIDVDSKEGIGTEFRLYLPAVESESVPQPELTRLHIPVGRGEMILLVDDEATILEITRKALEAHGYRVLAAGDGTEAISLYAQFKNSIDLVMVDILMPFMDGLATIRTLKKIDPNVKIILSSAYSHSIDDVESLAVKAVLTKPYTTQTLLRSLAGALAEGRSRGHGA